MSPSEIALLERKIALSCCRPRSPRGSEMYRLVTLPCHRNGEMDWEHLEAEVIQAEAEQALRTLKMKRYREGNRQ